MKKLKRNKWPILNKQQIPKIAAIMNNKSEKSDKRNENSTNNKSGESKKSNNIKNLI